MESIRARTAAMADRAVQKTDDDAAASKLSAVLRGYYQDELLPLFHPKPPVFRLPLINIGTYCRVQGINREIDRFLERTSGAPTRAIVSLGAGSDTRAFSLVLRHANLAYYELDFPVKIAAKQRVIADHPELQRAPASGRYHLVPGDLRRIDELDAALAAVGAGGQPVLVVSECCLCYLPLPAADRVLQFFRDRAPRLAVALYEPMSLHDEFGRVMAENMATRGLAIPTLEHYATLDAQRARLRDQAGATTADAVDINTVYTEWLSAADRARISRLEFLDEVEEMQLLLRHYCVAWGWRGLD